ncbi:MULTISPECIES: RDD family protein [unclassified Luteococcus]|uniref:RDD family protein n=1 Tax=unclassified Luteococcus TaxID=2639923 RepID=UPI00313EB01F
MPESHPPSQVLVRATGRVLPEAPASRRWWARLIDAAAVCLLCPTVWAVLSVWPGFDPSLAQAFAALSYPAGAILLGALYGRGFSPGQLLMRVKSRRTRDGRVVGAFRGSLRFLGVAFLPLWIWLLVTGGDPGAIGWDDDVIVTTRRA